MRLGKIIGIKLGRQEMVGLKIGNGPYLFETTGPSYWNKYAIQIPRGSYVTVTVSANSLSKNENDYALSVDWGTGKFTDYASGTKYAQKVYNTSGIAAPYETYIIRTTGTLEVNTSISISGDYVKDIASVRTDYITGSALFEYYSGIKTVREPVLERLNTSNVTDMSWMFSDCNSLTSLDVSNFNTSKVTTMSSMFSGCNLLTELDVSNFNTDKVTSIAGMFSGCNLLTELDVSSFNTSNITTMSSMFNGCASLINLDLRNFNTNNVKYMSSMFYGCSKLTTLNLRKFDTSKIIHKGQLDPEVGGITISDGLDGMFGNCNSLHTLRLDECSYDTVNDIINSLGFPTNKITGKTRTIYCKEEVANVLTPPSNWVFSSDLEEEPEVPVDPPEEPDVPVIPPEPEEPEIPLYQQGQFKGNPTIKTVETIVDSSHANLSYMFYNCFDLTSVNTEDWDTSSVTNMSYMFYNCYDLTELDLSNWDTSNVIYTNNMFAGCVNLEILDIRNFDAPSNGQTSYMFDGCNKLRVIRMDNCDNRAMKRYIDNQEDFPTGDIGVERVIYCKESSLVDSFGGRIYPPTDWKFEFVPE